MPQISKLYRMRGMRCGKERQSDRKRKTDRKKVKGNKRYALAAARVFAHGEPVIGLKLNLTMDGGTRNGHFIHTSDTL